jgi:mannose-6-phosphate isomerase-like protein (cupin superfamily)
MPWPEGRYAVGGDQRGILRRARDPEERRRRIMTGIVLNRDDLRPDAASRTAEFEGYQHADTNVSFIWVDVPPGDGPRLHKHPYEEVFIILEGKATFTVGAVTVEAMPGMILVAPPNTPHKFTNTGEGPLRQIDIHASPRFITEWLED